MSMKTANAAKKAFGIAERAYVRGERAKTCALAQTNLRLGQTWMHRGYDLFREVVSKKAEYRTMSPIQRELTDTFGRLGVAESRAHLNRLDRCGTPMLHHEHAAARDRLPVDVDRALDRRDRRRRRKR